MAPIGRWLVFDTGIYIRAIRGGQEGVVSLALRDALPRTYFSAVVAAELRAGALDASARKDAERFERAARGVGRFSVPSAGSWAIAGDVLGRIRSREPHLRSKLRTLWNDLLIALSARELGATLITGDAVDFEWLRRYTSFEYSVLV